MLLKYVLLLLLLLNYALSCTVFFISNTQVEADKLVETPTVYVKAPIRLFIFATDLYTNLPNLKFIIRGVIHRGLFLT
jgi:hypothetical protein